MQTKTKAMIASTATVVCAAVVVFGARAATPAQTTQYPWVQLPAWVGTTNAPVALPTRSYPWVQPPAWIQAG